MISRRNGFRKLVSGITKLQKVIRRHQIIRRREEASALKKRPFRIRLHAISLFAHHEDTDDVLFPSSLFSDVHIGEMKCKTYNEYFSFENHHVHKKSHNISSDMFMLLSKGHVEIPTYMEPFTEKNYRVDRGELFLTVTVHEFEKESDVMDDDGVGARRALKQLYRFDSPLIAEGKPEKITLAHLGQLGVDVDNISQHMKTDLRFTQLQKNYHLVR